MKKALIVAGIAVLAMTAIAGAAPLTLSGNLTVGSTGADVTALQTWLIGAGYDIPAVSTGAAAKGYFGAQTKTAVVKYQTAVGLPSTGFVGPMTRDKLSGSAVVTTTPTPFTCPAGYTCQPVSGTTPVVTTGVMSTPGVAGTLAFSIQSTPANNTSVDKGNSADVARYKLQAGASDMQVTSLSLDFDVRPWLYASSITVKDETGAVVAQKSGLTQSDFTELTVGSSYRLYVPMNFVVAKTATKYITVGVTLLPVTDRSAGNVTVTQAQIRSVDGTGVTDTETETTDRYFYFTGTNNGQIVVTADASSPLKRLVQVSTSAETDNVVLGIVDVKSQNKDATLRTLKVYVKSNGTSISTMFNDIKVKAGSLVYSADSIAVTTPDTTSSSTVTFSNMLIPLPKDTYVPITILGKVAKDTSGTTVTGGQASTTIVANAVNVVAEDSTFNAVTVNAATFISNDSLFTSSSALVSGASAVVGAPVTSSNVTVRYPVTYTFTLSAGDNTLYMSSVPGIALGTTTTGYTSNASTNASSTITLLTQTTPGSIAGDGTTYYVIPAGSSRTFKFDGVMQYEALTGGTPKTHAITTVYYGTTSSALQGQNINYGLEALKAVATF